MFHVRMTPTVLGAVAVLILAGCNKGAETLKMREDLQKQENPEAPPVTTEKDVLASEMPSNAELLEKHNKYPGYNLTLLKMAKEMGLAYGEPSAQVQAKLQTDNLLEATFHRKLPEVPDRALTLLETRIPDLFEGVVLLLVDDSILASLETDGPLKEGAKFWTKVLFFFPTTQAGLKLNGGGTPGVAGGGKLQRGGQVQTGDCLPDLSCPEEGIECDSKWGYGRLKCEWYPIRKEHHWVEKAKYKGPCAQNPGEGYCMGGGSEVCCENGVCVGMGTVCPICPPFESPNKTVECKKYGGATICCPEGSLCRETSQYSQGPNKCECPPGTEPVNDKCVAKCRVGEKRILDGCVPIKCDPGTELVGNECKEPCEGPLVRDKEGLCRICPAPFIVYEGVCTCPPGRFMETDADGKLTCTCFTGTPGPDDELIAGCPVRCKGNQQFVPYGAPDGPFFPDPKRGGFAGECKCHQGAVEIADHPYCECKPGRTLNEITAACECPKGKDDIFGECVEPCGEGTYRNEKGKCVSICVENADYDHGSKTCSCKKGYVPFDKNKCVLPCPGDKVHDKDGICQNRCDQNHAWSPTQKKCVAKCAPNDLITGQCICSPPNKSVILGGAQRCMAPCQPPRGYRITAGGSFTCQACEGETVQDRDLYVDESGGCRWCQKDAPRFDPIARSCTTPPCQVGSEITGSCTCASPNIPFKAKDGKTYCQPSCPKDTPHRSSQKGQCMACNGDSEYPAQGPDGKWICRICQGGSVVDGKCIKCAGGEVLENGQCVCRPPNARYANNLCALCDGHESHGKKHCVGSDGSCTYEGSDLCISKPSSGCLDESSDDCLEKPSECGNGVVEKGEQCDLGDENGTPGSSCGYDCQGPAIPDESAIQ